MDDVLISDMYPAACPTSQDPPPTAAADVAGWGRLLDVGAGDGKVTTVLAGQFDEVISVNSDN